MYNHRLRVHGEYLAAKQQIPKATQAVGNGYSQRVGSTLGAIELVIQAASAVKLSAGKSLTLIIENSVDNNIFSDLPITFKITAGASARTWIAGDVIGRMPLPSDTAKFVRAKVATDDDAATGEIDIIFDYLPR